MKRLKAPAAVVALAVILVACSTVAPGQDPILVRAQQTYSVALDSFDLLFNLENDNKALIEEKLPGTHAVVDKIKVQAKVALPALLSAIDTYKVNKDKDTLIKILAVVENLLHSAQELLPKVSAAVGK